ncbi:DUF397 domain-containing protein [Streptomyces sp. NPDC050315]|uniref:DUF397 domain-containing protein n=1 Tax=Streptomyces sp. NPDC050315 TaxID=3155039 RepID=UPI00341838D5
MSEQLTWLSSSYSDAGNAACVEVAASVGTVYVRDSKSVDRPDRPPIAFSTGAWRLFLAYTTAD